MPEERYISRIGQLENEINICTVFSIKLRFHTRETITLQEPRPNWWRDVRYADAKA